MTTRYEIKDNAEGTVIVIDGHPIQFSMILSNAQIVKYLGSREEQRKSAELTREAWEIGG